MDSAVLLVLSCATMAVASVVQRITGLGFALVATPPMVLLFGAEEGVKAVVVVGAVVSGVMIVTMWREVDWRRSAWIVLGGLLAAPLAAWVATALSPRALLVLVGFAALLSLAGGPAIRRIRGLTGRRGGLVSGAMSGFLHVTSGLSGPPLVVYGIQSRWEQRSFVASLQVVFIAFHAVTLGLRGLPTIPLDSMVTFAVSALTGLALGYLTARAVPTSRARRGMLVIAWVGTAAVLLRGLLG